MTYKIEELEPNSDSMSDRPGYQIDSQKANIIINVGRDLNISSNPLARLLQKCTDPIKRLVPEILGAKDFSKIDPRTTNSKWEAEPKKEYDGHDALDQYWKDLLGSNFAFIDPNDSKQELFPMDKVVLHDVVLTEWFPVVPGSQYDKNLFEANLQDIEVRAGAIRFDNFGSNESKIFSAHVIQPFVAHNEICKGIPVIIDPSVFKDEKYRNEFMKSINDFGAIHIENLIGIIKEIPDPWEKHLRLMYDELKIPKVEGTYRKPMALTIADKTGLSQLGTPAPLLGTAWTVWDNKDAGYDWHYFWTGIDDPDDYIKNAVKEINLRRPKNDGARALFDFDDLKIRFPEANISPSGFMVPLQK